MHQQKRQLERAKWIFSREHRLNLKALSYFPSTTMPLTAGGAPSRRLSSRNKTSLAQMSIEGRARGLLGGGYQQRAQMLQASSLVCQLIQMGCRGEQWLCNPDSQSSRSPLALCKNATKESEMFQNWKLFPLRFTNIILLQLWSVINPSTVTCNF